jgi:hypothetical protein
MSLCSLLANAGPAARNLLATSEARNLAVVLGVNPAGLLGLARAGTLDQLCAGMPGAAPLAAALMANGLDPSAANGEVYENCRVVRMPDGTMRVQCPDAAPGGACGCGNNCPPGCIPATQTGNANCMPADPTFAPCTVEQICSSYKYAPITASWAGIFSAPIPPADTQFLFQRVSLTRYVMTILPIGVASRNCLTSVQVIVGGTEVKPAAVAYTCSRLRQQPEGQWVWTWDTPTWIYGPAMVMTDGRCTCPPGSLCCCQVYNGPSRVIVDLANSPGDVALVTVTAAFGKDACGEAQCGPCPPGLICGTQLTAASYIGAGAPGPVLGSHSYLWGGGLPPQEPVLNLGTFGS